MLRSASSSEVYGHVVASALSVVVARDRRVPLGDVVRLRRVSEHVRRAVDGSRDVWLRLSADARCRAQHTFPALSARIQKTRRCRECGSTRGIACQTVGSDDARPRVVHVCVQCQQTGYSSLVTTTWIRAYVRALDALLLDSYPTAQRRGFRRAGVLRLAHAALARRTRRGFATCLLAWKNAIVDEITAEFLCHFERALYARWLKPRLFRTLS